ncbi:RNA polymerase II transcriptional coactivator KELP, partial [Linum grandiflorum]
MSQATEFKVRVLASMRLGMDLSDIEHKKFVRQVLESYLLSSAEQIDDANEGETATKKEAEVDDNGNRFVCKLSNRRSVTVNEYMGRSLVSIRDYYLKNGVELPSNK